MEPAILADWGKRLKRRRGSLTQTQLADLVGSDQGTISKIERGQLGVSDAMKWRLAGALATTVEDLFPWPAIRPPVRDHVAS